MYMEHVGKHGKMQAIMIQSVSGAGEEIWQRKQNEGKLYACTDKTIGEGDATTRRRALAQKIRTGTLARSSSWPKRTDTSM